MAVVTVNVPGAAYAVHIEPGLLATLGEHWRARIGPPPARVAVVTDSVVGPIYLKTVLDSLAAAGALPIDVTIPAGESNKALATLEMIYDRLLDARIDRSTTIIALGGGVVGDVAGFAAATLLRGVPFVQVPTTLLSMVDASVGGKTGVNHARGKNLIGAFHQPRAVFIDPRVLTTLSPQELRNGLAECIKHDVIRDADGFARLERDIGRALALDVDYLTELVVHNVAIKARVVEADPLERGARAHLNFGHTFGHALERVSGYAMAHGQAVGLGMIAAARAARAVGLLDDGSVRRIERLIAAAGLATGNLELDPDAVVEAMSFDKKATGGRLRLILPDRIGHVVIRDDVPGPVVREAVASLRE